MVAINDSSSVTHLNAVQCSGVEGAPGNVLWLFTFSLPLSAAPHLRHPPQAFALFVCSAEPLVQGRESTMDRERTRITNGVHHANPSKKKTISKF